MADEDSSEPLQKITARGKIIKGIRGASGPQGTISRQRPFFIESGVERATDWYSGTINIDLSPNEFQIVNPDHVVSAKWHPDYPNFEETFWLVDVTLGHKGNVYPAYLYYPCPSDFKVHPDTTIELVAKKIEDLSYGDSVTVTIPPEKIHIKP